MKYANANAHLRAASKLFKILIYFKFKIQQQLYTKKKKTKKNRSNNKKKTFVSNSKEHLFEK
jgi:hypothetical protein